MHNVNNAFIMKISDCIVAARQWWSASTAALQSIRHICVVVNVYRWQYYAYISIKRYFIIVSFQSSDDIIKIIIFHLSLFWFGP